MKQVLMMMLAVVMFANASLAREPSRSTVEKAFETFFSGATLCNSSSPAAVRPAITDVYLPSPTTLTVYFQAEMQPDKLMPGSLQAVYTQSNKWLWTYGSFGKGMGAYRFGRPGHFGTVYLPVC